MYRSLLGRHASEKLGGLAKRLICELRNAFEKWPSLNASEVSLTQDLADMLKHIQI